MQDAREVRARAIRFLSRRDYCRYEMLEKLVSKGAGREAAETVVDELSDSGLISEERFARELIRVRVRQGYGPVRIERELTHRGVADHLAAQCLQESEICWREQLERVIERKYRDSPVSGFNEWAKRANFLRGRGFTAEQIDESLGRYRSESQPEQI